MKKLVCLFIALVLTVSMCAVTTIAFAETEAEPAREVTFKEDVFNALDSVKNTKKNQAVTDDFKLDYSWLKDADKVASVFVGSNYILDTASDKEFAVTSESDKIFVEWCTPSKDYKDKWSCSSLTSKINISTTGSWGFRYVLKNKNGTTATGDTEEAKVLARTTPIYITFADETAPVINGLHSDMINAMKDGIKVGDTYTIKTNISISDTSSTTTSYVVYKKVKGAWTENPIYDSTTKVVAEGYENNITTAGVITMHEDDVLPNNEPMYKIVYTVKDTAGFSTVASEAQVLTLFAKEKEKEVDSAKIWRIILFVVAGLAAVGIIVVLCIKPKEAPAANTAAKKKDDSDKKQD